MAANSFWDPCPHCGSASPDCWCECGPGLCACGQSLVEGRPDHTRPALLSLTNHGQAKGITMSATHHYTSEQTEQQERRGTVVEATGTPARRHPLLDARGEFDVQMYAECMDEPSTWVLLADAEARSVLKVLLTSATESWVLDWDDDGVVTARDFFTDQPVVI